MRFQASAARANASCKASSALTSAADNTRSRRGYSSRKNESNSRVEAAAKTGECASEVTTGPDTPPAPHLFGRSPQIPASGNQNANGGVVYGSVWAVATVRKGEMRPIPTVRCLTVRVVHGLALSGCSGGHSKAGSSHAQARGAAGAAGAHHRPLHCRASLRAVPRPRPRDESPWPTATSSMPTRSRKVVDRLPPFKTDGERFRSTARRNRGRGRASAPRSTSRSAAPEAEARSRPTPDHCASCVTNRSATSTSRPT